MILALIWVACGIINYGLSLACYQRTFPFSASYNFIRDRRFVLIMSLLGPFSLLASLLLITIKGYYGFMFVWRNPYDE